MAARRMVPTRFFKNPDIMNLSCKDTQLILIGLILVADDEGREVAHAGLLGREIDYPAEQVEAALQELVANDLLLLYQAGKHRYYQLIRWDEWQTLGNKKTPSKYPAPPNAEANSEEGSQYIPASPRIFREDSGRSRGNTELSGKTPSQFNLIESNLTEDDGEENDTSQRGKHPQNVVPFPTPHHNVVNNANGSMRKNATHEDARIADLTRHMAHILKLPITEALARLVAEYAPLASLSLPGEADAAREWIDDSQRNKKHKRMSPAFFRNWLKREQNAMEHRQSQHQQAAQATGTNGPTPSPADVPPAAHRPQDLMYLADEDRQRTRGGSH